MKIYNTMTRKKEEFIPLAENHVRIYSCGPTVYNYFHIGNARPFIIFDLLRRYLEYRGYSVTFVQNFTDIDDKMIMNAKMEGITVKELAERFIREYTIDAQGLGIKKADVAPRATENIDAIIDMVKTLEEKGYAYEADGDVYFDTGKFNGYGGLSGQNLEELEEGARIKVGEKKKNAMDFTLWKAQKPGEPAWDSPWGKGRPGWHIECSTMANRYLGETVDIHCGGQDLVFPHHENEIAQSEAANGKPFARYWMHNAFLNVDNEKMSKSRGNFFTVRDIAKHYDYQAIRFFMLSAHYRSPLNFSEDQMKQAQNSHERICNCYSNLQYLIDNSQETGLNEDEKKTWGELSSCRKKFIEAMDDDLNTADALAAVFELVRESNTRISTGSSKGLVRMVMKLMEELTGLLGLEIGGGAGKIDKEVEGMIKEREKARQEKNYARADSIRDSLADKGIILEDTPQGTRWKRR